MGIIEIIKIIMAILAFISGLFQPKMGVRYVSHVTDYDCGSIRWTVPPSVSNGEFSGTAQITCEYEGVGGGGLMGLRSHFARQISQDGGGTAKIENYQGLPSLAFNTALDMGEGGHAYGTTHLASNGTDILKNVFVSSSIQATGAGSYLRGMYGAMEVRTTGESGVYRLTITEAFQVKKPDLMSTSRFKASLKDQAEESLLDRATSAVQETALHL